MSNQQGPRVATLEEINPPVLRYKTLQEIVREVCRFEDVPGYDPNKVNIPAVENGKLKFVHPDDWGL